MTKSFLDMATALSGSGPAYVFMFMEALIDAGVHMGFARRDAEKLVTQTLLGLGNLRGAIRIASRPAAQSSDGAPAAPPRPRSTKWKEAACALCFPKAFGRLTGARRHWAKRKTDRSLNLPIFRPVAASSLNWQNSSMRGETI